MLPIIKLRKQIAKWETFVKQIIKICFLILFKFLIRSEWYWLGISFWTHSKSIWISLRFWIWVKNLRQKIKNLRQKRMFFTFPNRQLNLCKNGQIFKLIYNDISSATEECSGHTIRDRKRHSCKKLILRLWAQVAKCTLTSE
jgi:hypothetical protein